MVFLCFFVYDNLHRFTAYHSSLGQSYEGNPLTVRYGKDKINIQHLLEFLFNDIPQRKIHSPLWLSDGNAVLFYIDMMCTKIRVYTLHIFVFPSEGFLLPF